ncbi:hypothetical protein Tco_1029755 [Tanacetum coccineum]|uniref:Transposase (Putative), gypsy type n=1 Tax=Tanacetum coccineum TaxID=301880 RepID=A0ABQ5G4X0_9ASTR
MLHSRVSTADGPNVGSGSGAPHAEEFVSSSVTPTPQRECQDEFDSTQGGNVRTRCASKRYVVLTSSSEPLDTNLNTCSKVSSPKPHVCFPSREWAETSSLLGNKTGASSSVPNDESPLDDFFKSQTIYSALAQDIYVSHWDVTNDARFDDPVMCKNLADHVPPPGYWASLRNRHDTDFLDLLNVNSAQHVYIVSELRLRYEHEILTREKFEQKFVRSSKVIQHRDVELVSLKANVEKDESKATVLIELQKRVSELETAAAAKSEEIEARRFEDQSAELDARIADLNHGMDTEIYPHMLTVVARRRWKGLEAGIEHGKVSRSLAEVKDYDSGVEAEYVVVVSEFENVYLPLLEQLEALKDSSLELLMSSLTLEGGHGDEDLTPEFCRLQLVSEQVIAPVYFERGGSRDPNSISHKILFSDAIVASHDRAEKRKMGASSSSATGGPTIDVPSQDNSLIIADYQISSVAIVDGTVPTFEPLDDLFDTTILDKLVDS